MYPNSEGQILHFLGKIAIRYEAFSFKALKTKSGRGLISCRFWKWEKGKRMDYWPVLRFLEMQKNGKRRQIMVNDRFSKRGEASLGEGTSWRKEVKRRTNLNFKWILLECGNVGKLAELGWNGGKMKILKKISFSPDSKMSWTFGEKIFF